MSDDRGRFVEDDGDDGYLEVPRTPRAPTGRNQKGGSFLTMADFLGGVEIAGEGEDAELDFPGLDFEAAARGVRRQRIDRLRKSDDPELRARADELEGPLRRREARARLQAWLKVVERWKLEALGRASLESDERLHRAAGDNLLELERFESYVWPG